MNIQFAHPEYLWFLLIIVPNIVWYIHSLRTRNAGISVSSLAPYKNYRPSFKQHVLHGLFGLRMLVIAALIVIIALIPISIIIFMFLIIFFILNKQIIAISILINNIEII